MYYIDHKMFCSIIALMISDGAVSVVVVVVVVVAVDVVVDVVGCCWQLVAGFVVVIV